MLDIQLFRNEPERVIEGLKAKRSDPSVVETVRELDEKRRNLTFKTEQLKKDRNESSKQIGQLMKEGKHEEADAAKARMREVGDETKEIDAELDKLNRELESLLLSVPNLPHESAPVGASEDDNVFVNEWGEKPSFEFEPKPHWELGAALDLLDSDRAVKLAGSMFFSLKGKGAKLQRALINFMLDFHVREHGYSEIRVPYLANRKTMTSTGQLPKSELDMYRIESDDFFLIPTSEVSVTNYHADEILGDMELPKAYTCYTPCFRREAGAAGKDNRGMLRTHQFDKVEMVRTVLPEASYNELETLRGHAEEILQSLGLHYRVLELCSADMAFQASKCYDLEVWAPGVEKYLEVSSCSNCTDFQARRANIRFRREKGAKPEFAHTLNGSGLALPRLMVALMETGQQPDGSIVIPEALRPYTGFDKIP